MMWGSPSCPRGEATEREKHEQSQDVLCIPTKLPLWVKRPLRVSSPVKYSYDSNPRCHLTSTYGKLSKNHSGKMLTWRNVRDNGKRSLKSPCLGVAYYTVLTPETGKPCQISQIGGLSVPSCSQDSCQGDSISASRSDCLDDHYLEDTGNWTHKYYLQELLSNCPLESCLIQQNRTSYLFHCCVV